MKIATMGMANLAARSNIKAVIAGALLLSGCATMTQEEYEASKGLWEQKKVNLECVQQGKGYDTEFRRIRNGIPSPIRYTKWLCSDGEYYMSPYEHLDFLRVK